LPSQADLFLVKRPAVLLACLAIAVVVVSAPLADSVTSPTLSVSESSPYEYVSGSTLYYAPTGTNSGTFTVTAKASAVSGIASVAFPAVFGSDSFIDTTSPYSQLYSWTSGTIVSGSKVVTATDKDIVPDIATSSFTLSPDTTAPSGQTVALSGGPGYPTLSVPLVLAGGTDAGSGLNAAGSVAERASATLLGGACGTFGSFAAVTLSGGVDTTVASGSCYRYQYTAVDNVGNTSSVSKPSADAKVDTTPPTTPTLLLTGQTNAAATGSVVFYSPTADGSFAVTAASTDGESGIASYTFPSLDGLTVVGTGASRIFRFSGGQSAPSAPLTVTATNGTGLTSPAASFTIVPDPTPPTLTIRCNGRPCLATPYPKAVMVTLLAADGSGSGVDTIRFTTNGTSPTRDRSPEYTGPFSVRTLTQLRARAYDRAGNPSSPLAITVRSLADRLLFSAPTQLAVKSGAHYVFARVTSTRRSIASATMTGPNLKRPHLWRFILGPGTSIVRLRLPAGLARTGRYRIVWTVQAGTQKKSKTTLVVLRSA
jgi:hypothetical protein